MSDITAQGLIELMARVPVEARPSSIESLLDIMSVREIEQLCIGAMVQWLDQYITDFSGNYMCTDDRVSVMVEGGDVAEQCGSTRLHQLVALVEQLAAQEAAQ